MLRSSIVLTGRLVIQKFNEVMQLVYETEVPNLVVTTGKEFIASRIVSNSASIVGYMGIGDDPTAVSLSQTTLGNQLSRLAVDSTTVSGTNVTFTTTFGTGAGTGSIQEAGLFNNSSGGTMLCRTTFPVITKSSGETITVTWVVSVG